ncbi:cyanophycinase [Arcticibacter sp.]|uniref:cyanophycinase n=1 Tax=Arcticibacter sp. TaxID=1872630 RepID=UPI00388F58EA
MVPKGKLVIIGGAVDLGTSLSYNEDINHPHYIKFFERGILKRMITESAKGEDSIVEVITTASKIPEIVGNEYIKSFHQLQVGAVNVMNIKTREEAKSSEVIERMKRADIVMLSGGDQLRLSAILGGTELHRILKKRYQEDHFVVGGTSAGAAAASTNMIYRGSSSEALLKGEVQITGGLGLLNNVIIDTHFVQRGRIGRLFYAVASNPGMLGIGLGEDAGLLITGGTSMEAIGSGLTILVDGRYINETSIYDVEIGSPVSIDNLKVHVMSIYDKYDLQQHTLTINKAIKIEDDTFLKAKDYD